MNNIIIGQQYVALLQDANKAFDETCNFNKGLIVRKSYTHEENRIRNDLIKKIQKYEMNYHLWRNSLINEKH